MRILIKIGALSFLILSFWLSLSYRLGGVGPNDFTYPKYQTPELAGVEGLNPPISAWQVQRSEALVKQSLALFNYDPKQTPSPDQITKSKGLAFQAFREDLTNGQAAAQLLGIYEYTKDNHVSDQLAELSSNLWPAYSFTRAQIADYWVRRNNIPNALKEWNVLLTRDSNLQKNLFPILVQIISDPEGKKLFTEYLETAPRWWPDFYNYITQQPDLEALADELYELRRNTDEGPTQQERNAYTDRLIKEKYWPEAYNVWEEGLSASQRKLKDLLYNGGFEGQVFTTGVFDWHLIKHKLLIIEPAITQGMKGSKALRVTLRDQDRIAFSNIGQTIVLIPNSYELLMRYKVDGLRTEVGLKWRLRCMDDQSIILVESPIFKERTEWNSLALPFTVPNNEKCQAQLLQLEAATPYAHQHLFSGTLWFDDISIRPVESEKKPTP